MQFKTLSVLSAAAGIVSAANHDVMVGQSGLTFSPNNLTAAQGDTVTFHYYPKAHSVVQAAFASPCQPLANGFFSGFVPSASGEANMTFVITVNTTKPIWFYCSQGSHCQAGMVGVINENATSPNTIDAFTTAAKAASNNTTPNENPGFGGKLEFTSSSSNSSSGNGASTLLGSSTVTFASLFALAVSAGLLF